MSTVTVSGLDGLFDDLMRLESKDAAKIIKKGLRQAATVVRNRAKKLVPVDTGLLRKSIKVYQTKGQRKHFYSYSVTGGGMTKKGKASAYMGEAYYGGFIELGTKRMKPHPFLAPAFDTTKNEALDALQHKVRDLVESMKKPGAK